MKKLLIMLVLFLLSSPVFAQFTLSRLSFDIGYVRNYDHIHLDYNELSVSPELKIGGKFLQEYFEWDFSLSYWIEQPDNINFEDGASYSYSNATFGISLSYFPNYVLPKFPLPVHLILGFSSNLFNEFYDGGSSTRHENSFFIHSLDLGGGVNFRLVQALRIRCEALAYIPLNSNENLYTNKPGASIKIGIDYIFLD